MFFPVEGYIVTFQPLHRYVVALRVSDEDEKLLNNISLD